MNQSYNQIVNTSSAPPFHILQEVQKRWGGEEFTVKSTDLNHTFIVTDAPTPYVIKTPRREADSLSAASEAEIVSILSDVSESSTLSFPSVIASHEQPSYTVFTHVPGVTITEYLVNERHLDDGHQRSIGASIGNFVAWMASEFSVERYMAMRHPPPPHPFDSTLDRILEDSTPIHNAGLLSVDMALKQVAYLRSRCPAESPIIGHNDLHTGNLLLESAEQPSLTGIIDFGNVQLTSPEHQLQSALRIGPTALDAAIGAYESESGRIVSQEHIRHSLLGRWAAICAYSVIRRAPILSQTKYITNYLGIDIDWEEIDKYNLSLKMAK